MLFVDNIKKKATKVKQQFVRYIIVGGVAFLFDFVILYLLTEYANLHYLLSAMFAFIVGLTINYLLSINWVFNIRRVKEKKLEFVIFATIGIVGLGLNEFFMWLITQYLLFHYLLSKVLTTAVIFFWNFYARKIVLFK